MLPAANVLFMVYSMYNAVRLSVFLFVPTANQVRYVCNTMCSVLKLSMYASKPKQHATGYLIRGRHSSVHDCSQGGWNPDTTNY